MSSSPDLSLRARLALGGVLVALAWALPRIDGVTTALGGTVIPLAAGLAAAIVLVAARRPFALWSPRALRDLPDPSRAAVLGCVIAAALMAQSNLARTRHLWSTDWSAVVALIVGAAVWGAVVSRAKQAPLLRWYAIAAVAALIPVAASATVLRPWLPAGAETFWPAAAFFLAADGAILLITEELAFRRALVGPPERAGIGTIALAAIVFGLWHAVQPGYGGPPAVIFVGTALGGFVAGCLYALSGSLSVAAAYHALHNAPLKALGGAIVVAGQGPLAGALGLALSAAAAVALGTLVWRRGGSRAPSLS